MISVCPYCGHLTTSQDGCSECPSAEATIQPSQVELAKGPLTIGDRIITVPEQPEELHVTIDREMGSRRILIDLGPLIDARDDARREVARLQAELIFLRSFLSASSPPLETQLENRLPADTTEGEN